MFLALPSIFATQRAVAMGTEQKGPGIAAAEGDKQIALKKVKSSQRCSRKQQRLRVGGVYACMSVCICARVKVSETENERVSRISKKITTNNNHSQLTPQATDAVSVIH